MRSAAGRFSTF
jgi:hypothetical protein